MTELGELEDDPRIANAVANFQEKLDNIEQTLTTAVEFKHKMYDRLTTEEKVQLDTYLAFATNSLYFMCVKLRGEDPKNHDISKELTRVRQAMERAKQIQDSKTLRPRIDKGAAGRFIKHSLPKHRRFQENASDDETQPETKKDSDVGQAGSSNKHHRFQENASDDEMEQEGNGVEGASHKTTTGEENIEEVEQGSAFITANSKLVAAGRDSSSDDSGDENENNFIPDS